MIPASHVKPIDMTARAGYLLAGLTVLSWSLVMILLSQVEGEQDWNLGIFTGVLGLISLALNVVGAMCSLVAICRNGRRIGVGIALAVNLGPVITILVLKIMEA